MNPNSWLPVYHDTQNHSIQRLEDPLFGLEFVWGFVEVWFGGFLDGWVRFFLNAKSWVGFGVGLFFGFFKTSSATLTNSSFLSLYKNHVGR